MTVYLDRHELCVRLLFISDPLFSFPPFLRTGQLVFIWINHFCVCFLFYFLFLLNRFDGLVDTTAGFNTTGGCWTTSSRRKMRFRCPSTITCSSYSPTIITAINAPSFSTSSSSTYAQFFMPHTSAIFNSFFFLSLSRLHTHTQPHANNRLLNYNRLKMADCFLSFYFFFCYPLFCVFVLSANQCVHCVCECKQ